jgi:hypothetical protein
MIRPNHFDRMINWLNHNLVNPIEKVQADLFDYEPYKDEQNFNTHNNA